MLTSLRIRNFKPWQDTGESSLRRITGLFGANSSGKSSILQLLRTVQSSVLSGAQRPLVIDENQAVGSLLQGEATSGILSYALGWEREQPGNRKVDQLRFEAEVWEGFDSSDRKFVAVALASGENPPVLNAVDRDWWEHREALEQAGLRIEFLCPEAMGGR